MPKVFHTGQAGLGRALTALPLVATVLATIGLLPPVVSAEPSRIAFSAAQARERAARVAIQSPRSSDASALVKVRSAVAAYEKVATRDPQGGYADTSLWLGAELAADAFAAFGQERDRTTSVTLARTLIRRHPDSVYAAKARDHLARLHQIRPGPPVPVRGIQQHPVKDGTELRVDVDRAVWFRTARLDNPPRTYVDLYNTTTPLALRNAVIAFDSGPITRLRFGHHARHITRLVFEGDLSRGCSSTISADPPQLVVSCIGAAPVPEPLEVEAAPPKLPRIAPAVLSDRRATPEPSASACFGLEWQQGDGPADCISGTSDTVVAVVPIGPEPAGDLGDVEPPGITVASEIKPLPEPEPAPETEPAPDSESPPHPPLNAIRLGPLYVELMPAAASTTVSLRETRALPGNGPVLPLLFGADEPPPLVSQRPMVEIGAAAQVLSGDVNRIGFENTIQPDLGVRLSYPRSRIGNIYADANVTSRGNRLVLGRGLFRLDGLAAAGMRWSLDAGDTWTTPVTPDFGFSNLFAPPINLRGMSVRGRSDRTALQASAARLTLRRNIFGTDTLPTGQQLAQVAVSHWLNTSLDVFGRVTDTRGVSPIGFTSLVETSTEAGGGLRLRPTPSWQLVADVGYSTFRRTGSNLTERDVSGLVGATWSVPRGWVQMNASRFSLGHYAVGSYPYNDRSGLFAAGEWMAHDRFSVYAGTDFTRTGLDPSAAEHATVSLPAGTAARTYGGFRLQAGNWSTLGVRVDGGGREIYASPFGGGFASDTATVSADWNLRLRGTNAMVRYERRSNVDAGAEGSNFTQHDASTQAFFSLGGQQVFVQGLFSQRIDQSGAGSGQTLWQASAGSQMAFGRIFTRVEGAAGHTRDWLTQQTVRRKSLSASMSGRVAEGTQVSIDLFVDHTPSEFSLSSPWVVRTMIRVTQSFAFGAARATRGPSSPLYRGPTGRVAGVVFADWNGNGTADLDEEAVPGVRIVAGRASVTGNGDGRFAIDSIPTGEQTVSLDLASVPAAYDPPVEPERTVLIATKQTATLDFGLVPLGTIQGVVYQDVDGDGTLTPPDVPISGAVLVLDDGVRTEVTRDGRFWFDNVRTGAHTVSLLVASLEEGAQLAESATLEVELSRNALTRQVVFTVTMEKRPEIRKVFTPKPRTP